MVRMLQDEDIIELSRLDIKILTALLADKMTGYEIGRQCERDAAGGKRLSNGTLHPALNSLERYRLVSVMTGKVQYGAKIPKVYTITDFGKELLGYELKRSERLIKLAKERGLRP